MAKALGLSLGKTNYCVQALLKAEIEALQREASVAL